MQFEPLIKDEETKDLICGLYLKGLSAPEIRAKLIDKGINIKSKTPIVYVLKHRGIKLRSRSDAKREYECNQEYFSTINSHQKAQLLGMLAADGNVHRNTIKLALAVSDVEYLYFLNKELETNYPIRIYKRQSLSQQDIASLSLTSKRLCEDLYNLGIVPCKSLILRFPTEERVPYQYINSYILGYFDGDGSIYTNPKTGGTMICICGTIEFCESLRTLLERELNINAGIHKRHKNRPTNSYQLMFGGNLNVIRFCEWIYKDTDFRMSRKYQVFKNLRIQYPELIEGSPLQARGERQHLAKLNDDKVRMMRDLYHNKNVNLTDLSRQFNVAMSTTADVVNGTTWKHVI